MPISAEALPACAAWRASAPTMVLALVKPMQLIATNIGAMTSGRMCTPANASAASVAGRASEHPRDQPQHAGQARTRGSSRAIELRRGDQPDTSSAPKISANSDGVRPNPWMNTGDEPAR